MELEQARRMIATPQVELFKYGGDPSNICGGAFCGGQRVCVVKPGMCSYKHHPKLHDRLAPGFYIRPCLGRGGASFYLSPTVSALKLLREHQGHSHLTRDNEPFNHGRKRWFP